MRTTLLLLALLLCAPAAAGQGFSSHVEIVTVYSQNGRFYLKSVPFDNEEPSLRGRTSVYEAGADAPLYVFERGFDFADGNYKTLALSDDGQVIFYAIPYGADEAREGLKSVNIYRAGRLVKSFTETELTGCDKQRERCSLVYTNHEEVIDGERSRRGTPADRKVFKEGVGEREKFLNEYAVFSSDDTVYLTDSKKRTHLFDLKRADHVRSAPFDELYESIKDKARAPKAEQQTYRSPTFLDFPRLKDGRDSAATLADLVGMRVVAVDDKKSEQYKLYYLKITANIRRDGGLELEEVDADAALPKEKIVEFLTSNKFDSTPVPLAFDKWNIREHYITFRKKDVRAAREEGRLERARRRAEYERRLTLESIEGVYIPKDLGECMTELDKKLSEIDRQEMRALPAREDMIGYHLGLGTWMRNYWGLWSSSRLQKYFREKGVAHPESMSTVILYHYHDWLNGRRETWKEWERNPKAR